MKKIFLYSAVLIILSFGAGFAANYFLDNYKSNEKRQIRPVSLNIKLRDGLEAAGLHYKAGSGNLIIFLHGLGGWHKVGLTKLSQEYFTREGFDCYIYHQYGDEKLPDGSAPRSLKKSITLERTARDLADIFAHFKPEYKNIFLVGHSYGGLTIIRANLPAAAVALYDATRPSRMEGYLEEVNVNPLVFAEAKEMIEKDTPHEWAVKFNAPAFIANAEPNDPDNGKYAAEIPNNKYIVYKADHWFSEPWLQRGLFRDNLKFFKKYSR